MKVEEAVQAVSLWSEAQKLRLNVGKCELSFFSMDPREAGWRPEVRLGERALRVAETPRFLGVVFDRTLSFRPHAVRVAEKVGQRCRVLSALAGQEWGWKRKGLVRVYKTFIRPVLDYCGCGWQPWLAPSNLAILTRAQNKALRWITGQCRTTPVEALTLEAGLPQYGTVVRRNCVLGLEQALRLPTDNPRWVAATTSVVHRIQRASSWRREATVLSERLGLGEFGREPLGPLGIAPWWWSRRDNWWVDVELGGRVSKSSSAAEQLEAGLSAIRRYGPRVTIYTDGSVAEDLRSSGSAAVVTVGPAEECRVVDVLRSNFRGATCSFEAEVRALSLAVGWVRSADVDAVAGGEARDVVGPTVLICSDSRSALVSLMEGRLLQRASLRRLQEELDGLGHRVLLQWVPAHCGLSGNERADEEANVAWRSDVGGVGVDDCGLSFESVKALVRRLVCDPPPEHPRVAAVYCPPSVNRGRLSLLSSPSLTRAEAVLLAQLRSGHCMRLAAYAAVVSHSGSGICPFCTSAQQTLEHWLQGCDAKGALRQSIFGTFAPPLSVLLQDPGAVLTYARATILRPP